MGKAFMKIAGTPYDKSGGPAYIWRLELTEDARRASEAADSTCRRDWIDPGLWSEYMGKKGRYIYDSFTNKELLDILRNAAEELGRVPTQKEVFCVYRLYIRRRFTNWPTALRTAGLKPPKKKAVLENEKSLADAACIEKIT